MNGIGSEGVSSNARIIVILLVAEVCRVPLHFGFACDVGHDSDWNGQWVQSLQIDLCPYTFPLLACSGARSERFGRAYQNLAWNLKLK